MGSSPTHAVVQVGTFWHSWYQYRKFATTEAHYLRNTLATIRGALLKIHYDPHNSFYSQKQVYLVLTQTTELSRSVKVILFLSVKSL